MAQFESSQKSNKIIDICPKCPEINIRPHQTPSWSQIRPFSNKKLKNNN